MSVKKVPYHQHIRVKVNIAIGVTGLLIMFFSIWLLHDSMSFVEKDLMNDRLESDLKVLRDYLGETDGAAWRLEEDGLYVGDTFIGDGTLENANEAPLIHLEELTGTFFYIFIKTDNDSDLSYVEDKDYEQGHFLRACGTTRGLSGERLEGTYMDKKAVEALESSPDGTYTDVANVNGRMIYCHYELLRDESGRVIGVISNGRSVDELEKLISTQRKRGVVLIFIEMIIISSSLGLLVTLMLKSIRQIRERVNRITEGELPEDPLILSTKDELSEVADDINSMVESLREKDRIQTELNLATDIQAHMLPSIFPAFPEHDEFDLYAVMNPAKEVGGDFYDFFMLDETHVAVVIADVSGKGVPAALFMVIAKTLIKNHAQMGLALSEVFTRVNQMLAEDNESGLFVTAWMAVLDTEKCELTYVNAGHNPPMIRRSDGNFEFLRSKPCFVLAGMEGVRYRQTTIPFMPGDKLFLYTDGVTEATNSKKELYGEARLEAFLNYHTADTATELVQGVRHNIDAFVAGAEQFDDITMLVLDFKKKINEDAFIKQAFEADEENLEKVQDFVGEYLEKADCPMKAMTQIQIAVEELFVNVCRYAYAKGADKADVVIHLGEYSEGGLILKMEDAGMPFDPFLKNDPDITLSAEERSVGGLGIFMVKKTMDTVDYAFENGRNVVTIVKRF